MTSGLISLAYSQDRQVTSQGEKMNLSIAHQLFWNSPDWTQIGFHVHYNYRDGEFYTKEAVRLISANQTRPENNFSLSMRIDRYFCIYNYSGSDSDFN